MERPDTMQMTFLKQADKCIREGNLMGALALIQKAREENPENRYAEAYEERVRSLLAVEESMPVAESMAPVVPDLTEPAAPLAEIVDLLHAASDAVSGSDFRGALTILGQARQLDPDNSDISALEEQIRAALEAPTTEPPPAEDEAVRRATIRSYCQSACDLVARGAYDDAMALVTRGFVLDPSDPDLLECECLITTSRSLADELMAAQDAARAHEEQERKETAERAECIARHLARARELTAAAAFDEALTEIALGFLVDPESKELRTAEQEVWKNKNALAREAGEPRTSDETARLIRLHILAAEEYARNGDFTGALDGLAKAYVMDPTNTDVKRAEVRIRQQELRHHQQSAGSPLKLVYHYDRVVNGE